MFPVLSALETHREGFPEEGGEGCVWERKEPGSKCQSTDSGVNSALRRMGPDLYTAVSLSVKWVHRQ